LLSALAFISACFQRLKLNYDKLLSNFACFGFNCNLRPFTKVLVYYCGSNDLSHGVAVQAHPGFAHLTPALGFKRFNARN